MRTPKNLIRESAPFIAVFLAAMLLLLPSEAYASGALSGGGGAGLPYEQGVGAIWRSVSQFVAPIAVALGVIIGIILFARGSAGAAVYTLFGFALVGGVALGITEIFNVFGWDGATVNVRAPAAYENVILEDRQ